VKKDGDGKKKKLNTCPPNEERKITTLGNGWGTRAEGRKGRITLLLSNLVDQRNLRFQRALIAGCTKTGAEPLSADLGEKRMGSALPRRTGKKISYLQRNYPIQSRRVQMLNDRGGRWM